MHVTAQNWQYLIKLISRYFVRQINTDLLPWVLVYQHQREDLDPETILFGSEDPMEKFLHQFLMHLLLGKVILEINLLAASLFTLSLQHLAGSLRFPV